MTPPFGFDDERREVVFSRHDTPTPWINYLSNGTFHGFLSQAGGGLFWYKSPQIWRINRYRFFHLPTDRTGPYVYVRHRKSGEIWCPTVEPSPRAFDLWEAAHGLGYTRFHARIGAIDAILTYFVGPTEDALIWRLSLRNDGTDTENLSVFAYVEYGLMEFQRELSWQCYLKHQVQTYYRPDPATLVYRYGVENQARPDETPLVYLAGDRPADGYDGDRDMFVGNYRSETNPVAVERGSCTGSQIRGGDPCGALQFNLDIPPEKTETLTIYLGTGPDHDSIDQALMRLREPGAIERSLGELQDRWSRTLSRFACLTPDRDVNRMLSVWNPYQCDRNLKYSRNISFYATGTFRGVGFRDSAQDSEAMVPIEMWKAKEKIRELLGQQYHDGHVNHYFFPEEQWDPVTSIHSDDHLWVIKPVRDLICEEGSTAFLREEVSFFDQGRDTVYAHLRRSLEFTANNLGVHGFPLILRSDWNDQTFRVGRLGRGESIWSAMQVAYMAGWFIELAELMDRDDDSAWARHLRENLLDRIENTGWDGAWYRRAIMDDGTFLGSSANAEAQLWLMPQAWSAMCGVSRDRAISGMDAVHRRLNTPIGIKMIDPPITWFPDPAQPLTNYNPGLGENASIFCHANTWAILAEALLGRADRAWEYYRQLIPERVLNHVGVDRYRAEPYAYSSNIFGPDSDRFGLANVSWVTGTAQGMYKYATQYLLGVRAEWNGLRVAPVLPSDWLGKTVEVQRTFRGRRFRILIDHQDTHGSILRVLDSDAEVRPCPDAIGVVKPGLLVPVPESPEVTVHVAT